MAKYKLLVSWELATYIEVEADSVEDAIDIAETLPLPLDGSYVDGSFKVDTELAHGDYEE